MSGKVCFISDYHFGHAKVIKFEDNIRGNLLGVDNIFDHDKLLIDRTYSVINKRDTLWILGDNGNKQTIVDLITNLKCIRVNYIPGNHDNISMINAIKDIPKVQIKGFCRYKKHWITHCPIHPQELRELRNIHGHTHSKVIRDPKYICVSIENNKGYPVPIDNIINDEYITWNNFT